VTRRRRKPTRVVAKSPQSPEKEKEAVDVRSVAHSRTHLVAPRSARPRASQAGTTLRTIALTVLVPVAIFAGGVAVSGVSAGLVDRFFDMVGGPIVTFLALSSAVRLGATCPGPVRRSRRRR
jgi:hypothetical protein